MIMLTVSIAVFSIKDRIDTAHLEKISGNAAKVDKDITTVISINMHAEITDVDDIDILKVDDMPPQTTHIFRKIVLLSLGGLSIIVVIVKRGGENERHHKGK